MWIREAQQSDEAEIFRLHQESGRTCRARVMGDAGPLGCAVAQAACWVVEHQGRLRAAVRTIPVRDAHELQALVCGSGALGAGVAGSGQPACASLVALPSLHLMDLVCERSSDSARWASMLHLHCLEQAMARGMASITGSQACGSFAADAATSAGMGLQRLKVLGYCFQPVERGPMQPGQDAHSLVPNVPNWLGALPQTRFEQTRRALRLRHSPVLHAPVLHAPMASGLMTHAARPSGREHLN